MAVLSPYVLLFRGWHTQGDRSTYVLKSQISGSWVTRMLDEHWESFVSKVQAVVLIVLTVVSMVMIYMALAMTCSHPNETDYILNRFYERKKWFCTQNCQILHQSCHFDNYWAEESISEWPESSVFSVIIRSWTLGIVWIHLGPCGPTHLPMFSQCRCHRPCFTRPIRLAGSLAEILAWEVRQQKQY